VQIVAGVKVADDLFSKENTSGRYSLQDTEQNKSDYCSEKIGNEYGMKSAFDFN
jgi:hypothetical protein